MNIRAKSQFRVAAAVGVAIVSAATAARGSTCDGVSLADQLRLADAVVEGVVTRIEHRNAEPLEPGGTRFPHTFVTFAVEHTFKGRIEAGAREVTLRFLGGPNGSGLVLRVAGVPEFQPGDREILFVSGNGVSECPLVGMDHGRIRIVRGEVIDGHGNELWVTPAGTLHHGPEPSNEAEAAEPPAGSVRPDAAGLRAILGAAVTELAARGELAPTQPVLSSRIAEPFRFGIIASAPPAERQGDAREPVIQGEPNAREAELLRRGN